MTDEQLRYAIRGAIYKVYKALGPGLLELAYEAALCRELFLQGLEVETQVSFSIQYESLEIPNAYRLDVLVNKRVIIELKSVAKLERVHYKQLRTYLKLTGIDSGILVNFNTDDIIKSTHTLFANYEDYQEDTLNQLCQE